MRLKQYGKYEVLIIDEISYISIDKLGANLFFQLIIKGISIHQQ
ncbi:ATP-binding protein [Clostridium sulfidigenes]